MIAEGGKTKLVERFARDTGKLWNGAPIDIKDAPTKGIAKKLIRECCKTLPISKIFGEMSSGCESTQSEETLPSDLVRHAGNHDGITNGEEEDLKEKSLRNKNKKNCNIF